MNTSNSTIHPTSDELGFPFPAGSAIAAWEALKSEEARAYEGRNKRVFDLETATQIRNRIKELAFHRENYNSTGLEKLWENVSYDMERIVMKNIDSLLVVDIFAPFMTPSMRDEVSGEKSRRIAVLKPYLNQLNNAISGQKWEVVDTLLGAANQVAKARQTPRKDGTIVVETVDNNGKPVRTTVTAKAVKPRSSRHFASQDKPRNDRHAIALALAEEGFSL